jgi:predicted  nucleic acid-binding Zn-ribbon protein
MKTKARKMRVDQICDLPDFDGGDEFVCAEAYTALDDERDTLAKRVSELESELATQDERYTEIALTEMEARERAKKAEKERDEYAMAASAEANMLDEVQAENAALRALVNELVGALENVMNETEHMKQLNIVHAALTKAKEVMKGRDAE